MLVYRRVIMTEHLKSMTPRTYDFSWKAIDSWVGSLSKQRIPPNTWHFSALNMNGCYIAFWYLESWILDLRKNAFWMHSLQNPRSKIPTRLAKKYNFRSPENALNSRIQNVKKNAVNTTKFAWNVGLGGVLQTHDFCAVSISILR